MSTNKGTYNHAKLDEAIADNMLEEELDKKPAAVPREKVEKKKRTHQRSTDTSTSANSPNTLASDPAAAAAAAASPPLSSRHHGHHSKHRLHGHSRRHDHHSHLRRPREPEVAGARTKGTEDNKYNIATPSNSESHANTPCSASKPPVVAPVRPTADPSPVIVPALNPRGPPSRHPRMPDSDDYAITAQPNTARNTNSPWASSWNPTEVARQTTKRRSATTNYDDTTVAPTRPTQQAAASLTTMADADVEDRKRPASKKEYTQPSADSSAMSVVVPNPRPAPVGLPSRGPAASNGNGLNEYEAHTSTDIETGEVLDTNEQVWSLPRPPREERRPGAFHPDGRNAREVSVVDENTVITPSEPDVPVSPAPVEEVFVTLVDQDEECENVEVADVVTEFWCSPRIKRFISLGVSLVVVLAIAVAIVLGTVLPRALEPASPPTAAPTSPLPGLIELLSSVSFDGGVALETPGTPQNKALNWLANNNTYLVLYSDDKMIQRYVLVTLYYSTNGDSWYNNNDWLSDRDECDWYNRAGDNFCSNGAIVDLKMDSNNLNGTIPAELALLSNSVDKVQFEENSLTGTIPTEIAQMTKLSRELWLYNNALTGTIPSEIALMTELGYLHLNNNALTGSLPTEIALMTSLYYLHLYNNALMGTIPSEIAQMTNLSQLYLHNNALTGTIPSEIAQMTNLYRLYLSNNKLTGTIPSEIAQMTDLYRLYLSNNKLTGTIPSEIAQMTKLKYLYLYNNTLTGTIPSEIAQMTNLNHLSLPRNKLTGTIPTEIALMTSLDRLFLNNNALTGTIPSEIAQMTELEVLELDQNALTGTIPSEIALLTNLVYLALFDNKLTGTIPTEIALLTKLDWLSLHDNAFSGNFTCPFFIERCYISCDDSPHYLNSTCRSL